MQIPGMGRNVLILAFVVIVIGGLGSVHGAFVAAILVGIIDTIGPAFLTGAGEPFVAAARPTTRASAFLDADLCADGGRLFFRPEGLFPRKPASMDSPIVRVGNALITR